jgi:hypothetical protein
MSKTATIPEVMRTLTIVKIGTSLLPPPEDEADAVD